MQYDTRFNPDSLVNSESYADTMRTVVVPYIRARRHDRTVPGAGGRPLFVSRFDAECPQGSVLIVHGFTENADKYSELIYSLLLNGLSVCAYDQRGHGRSWRTEGIDDLSLTHVDHFDEYVRDTEIICRDVLSAMPKPFCVFCHSMGGAVTALYLESHSGLFDRAVMCAPMIAPHLKGLPRPVARGLCLTAKALKRGRSRILFSKPYQWPEAFESSCATGRARFDWYESLRREHPEFRNNGPTYGWTLESIDVTGRILAPDAPEKIDIPVRLYTAEFDGSVRPDAQQRFIGRVRRGEQSLVKGARHEIYRSSDEVLFPWWHEVLAFLKG